MKKNIHIRFVLGAELTTSDLSRNVVEKIVQSTSKRKSCRRVKKIKKVNHPPKMLERYERYREEMKKEAREFHNWDPRIMVDGNEILKFYCTTMNCCHKNKRTVTQVCDAITCGVSMTIESEFRINAATRKVRIETALSWVAARR